MLTTNKLQILKRNWENLKNFSLNLKKINGGLFPSPLPPPPPPFHDRLRVKSQFKRQTFHVPNPILSIYTFYVRVNSSREYLPGQTPWHNPGNLKKLFKCPIIRGKLVGKCPAPRMMVKCPAPSPSDQYTKLLVVIFNKHNSFGSIELHKNRSPNESLRLEKINALHLTPKWQCSTAWNPWLSWFWAPSEMTTGCYETSFLLFGNTRGAWTLLTAKCPDPGTHRATNDRGLPRGISRGWNWLAHYKNNFIRDNEA